MASEKLVGPIPGIPVRPSWERLTESKYVSGVKVGRALVPETSRPRVTRNSLTAASSSGVRISRETERGLKWIGWAPLLVCWYAILLRRSAIPNKKEIN